MSTCFPSIFRCCIRVLLGLLLALTGAGAQEANVRSFEAHDAPVYRVVFDPRGQRFATGSADGLVRLWSRDGQAPLSSIAGDAGKVLDISFSPDGERVIVAYDDRTARSWFVPSAAPTEVPAHDGDVLGLVVAPDRRWFASRGADRRIVFWSLSAGKIHTRTEPLDVAVRELVPSADSLRLACIGSDDTVRAHLAPPPPASNDRDDLETWIGVGATWRLLRGKQPVDARWNGRDFDDSSWERAQGGFGYSSNASELETVRTRLEDMRQSYLSIFTRTRFRVAAPEKVVRLRLTVHVDDGFVAYLNGTEVARTNVRGRPPAFDTAAESAGEPEEQVIDLMPFADRLVPGENVLAVQGHNGNLTSSDLVLTPILEGKLQSEKESGQAPGPGDELARSEPLEKPLALAFEPSGEHLVVSLAGGELAILEAQSLRIARVVGWPGGTSPRALAFRDDGVLIGLGDDGRLRGLELAGGTEVFSFEATGARQAPIAVSPSGQIAAVSQPSGSVGVWSLQRNALLRELAGGDKEITSISLGRDGDDEQIVVVREGGVIDVWSDESDNTETPVARFEAPGEVAAAIPLGDDRYASAGPGSSVHFWKRPRVESLATYGGHGGAVYAVDWAARGNHVATGSSDKMVRLWPGGAKDSPRELRGHEGSVYCVAFSPDATLLASGSYDRTIRLWKVPEATELGKLEGHREGVFAVAFSGDGSRLLSASTDGTVRRWNVASGAVEAVLQGHEGWVLDLDRIAGDDLAVSIDHGGRLVAWNLGDASRLAESQLGSVAYSVALSPDGSLSVVSLESGRVAVVPTPGWKP